MANFCGFSKTQDPSSETINMRIPNSFCCFDGARLIKYPACVPDFLLLVDFTSTNNISPSSFNPMRSHGPNLEILSKVNTKNGKISL